MYMQENIQCYLNEKEKREKRLEIYAEKIQEIVLNRSEETIRELVKERHNQNDPTGDFRYYRYKTIEFGSI